MIMKTSRLQGLGLCDDEVLLLKLNKRKIINVIYYKNKTF